jgi:hypothetical protein
MKPPAESKIKAIVTDDTPTLEEETTAYHSPLFRESATFLNQMNSTPGIAPIAHEGPGGDSLITHRL